MQEHNHVDFIRCQCINGNGTDGNVLFLIAEPPHRGAPTALGASHMQTRTREGARRYPTRLDRFESCCLHQTCSSQQDPAHLSTMWPSGDIYGCSSIGRAARQEKDAGSSPASRAKRGAPQPLAMGIAPAIKCGKPRERSSDGKNARLLTAKSLVQVQPLPPALQAGEEAREAKYQAAGIIAKFLMAGEKAQRGRKPIRRMKPRGSAAVC